MDPSPLPWPVLLVIAAVALLSALAAASWIFFYFVRPARALRRALAEMAEGEPGKFLTHFWQRGAFRQSAAHLETLAARLRETDRQLHDENFNLQAILGSLSEGVLIVDRAQKIRLANAGLRRMFDFSASPWNRTLLEVYRDHDVQGIVRAALAAGAAPQSRTLPLATRGGDGRYAAKHFHVTAAGLLPSGGHAQSLPSGAIAIFHDVTQLRALETVRRDFVMNVSHELRTPLSIINGYLETLLEPDGLPDEATARRFLNVMWKHGQRLHLLLEDLLTLARLENGGAAGVALRFAPVDLRGCLERVIERLAPVIAEKHALVRLDLPADTPPIEGDAHRLDQVFFNLLDNALKHGVRGANGANGAGESAPIQVRVRAEFDHDETGQALIEFSDNGAGIPLADQPHLFERFYRVHKDRSRDAGGTGLGLAIVKHVVQAHGGHVSVESTPGHGATFRVRLPLAQDIVEK